MPQEGRQEGRGRSFHSSSYRYIYVLISHEEDEAAEALFTHASVSHYRNKDGWRVRDGGKYKFHLISSSARAVVTLGCFKHRRVGQRDGGPAAVQCTHTGEHL